MININEEELEFLKQYVYLKMVLLKLNEYFDILKFDKLNINEESYLDSFWFLFWLEIILDIFENHLAKELNIQDSTNDTNDTNDLFVSFDKEKFEFNTSENINDSSILNIKFINGEDSVFNCTKINILETKYEIDDNKIKDIIKKGSLIKSINVLKIGPKKLLFFNNSNFIEYLTEYIDEMLKVYFFYSDSFSNNKINEEIEKLLLDLTELIKIINSFVIVKSYNKKALCTSIL